MIMGELIAENIEVTFEQRMGGKLPVAFRWRGEDYEIHQVLEMWEEHGMGKAPLRRPHWWQRRHRVHYIVKLKDGDIYEIYWDRGSKKKDWTLLKRI